MASFGSKKEFSKRDMNFFAEFTAAAARATRLIGYIAVLMVVAVVAIILTLVYFIIRNIVISQEVKDLEATLASDEYKNVRTEADQLAAKLEQRYNYYYSLSQMRKQVDTTPNVKMNLVDLIGKSIPSDTRITTYDLSGTTLTITGETFLSRSPNDFVNLIQKNETFTSQCDLKVSRISPDQFGEYTAFLKDNNDNTKVYSDVIYSFEVTGTLINDVYVSVSKFVKDETSDNKKISCLDVIPPEQVKVRKTWTINDIAKLEKNNVKYELVGITLNGRDIKKEDFDRIKGQDMYSIVVTSNTDIGLYYSVVQETAAEKNDADNKESEATK